MLVFLCSFLKIDVLCLFVNCSVVFVSCVIWKGVRFESEWLKISCVSILFCGRVGDEEKVIFGLFVGLLIVMVIVVVEVVEVVFRLSVGISLLLKLIVLEVKLRCLLRILSCLWIILKVLEMEGVVDVLVIFSVLFSFVLIF